MRIGQLSLCVLLLGSFNTFANANEENVEPVKESVGFKNTSTQEILDLQSRLQTLKTKINAQKETLKKLIADKQAAKDERVAVQIVNDMKLEHKELQANIKEYEEQRSLLNYRYPEKGRVEVRVYERIELKSLDELENEFSIEGKIKKALVKVRQQYPSQRPKALPIAGTEESAPRSPAAAESSANGTSRSSVTESQILSK